MRIGRLNGRGDMQVLFISQQLRNKNILNGGDIGSRTLYKAFCFAVGKNNVKLIDVPEEKKVYKRYFNYLFMRNMYTKKQENQLIEEINNLNYDLIVLDGSWFGRLLNRVRKKKNVILFLHNIEVDYSIQRFRRNFLTFIKLINILSNEKTAIKYAKHILVLNDRDQYMLAKYYKREADLQIPVVISDRYIDDKQKIIDESDKEENLLFVGSYFSPNVEGIKWFIQNVMPYVNKKLIIAGKGMERLKYLETANVKVVGTVNDLDNLYIKSEAVVMPIFSGGGMKVKTAEAMMYGKKIFATDEALNGYDISNLNCIFRCNTAEEFCENINLQQDKKSFYSDIRKRFLQKYEQSSRNQLIKDFLTNEFYLDI